VSHDFYDHPADTAEQAADKRRRRHAYWLSILTKRDWKRIGELADQTSEMHSPARLDDLDARGIAVGTCPVGNERYVSGERIGTLRDGSVVVLVWRK
jgi:hypothetical protein